ncbi:hypothetical protein ACFPPD_06885 [Cohnella suwonensis]|uniref:Uncharacterized protein n=1 Tax=Cohnella suwonensis TaxID=696072 RepID=A0ABW0LRB3_9BACL
MSATAQATARDLDADLAICEAATPGPWIVAVSIHVVRDFWENDGSRQVVFTAANDIEADARFTAEARQGWPYAIRRAQEAEERMDKLKEEIRILQDSLNGRQRRGCWD